MAEYATDGTDNRQMHWIESPEPMDILYDYVDVAREIRDPAMTHMDRLGHEYEMLKTLLSDLHKYVTSNLEINDSPFERELKPDPPMANLYRQAQDIYHFLKTTKEMESEMASSSKQLMELLSLITGDGEHHKTFETGRKGRTKDVSQSLLEQSDRQKKEFQHALSVLEQIKQRQQHMDRLGYENEILKNLLSDLHKYLTSHMEINDSPFELSSAFRPDPPVVHLYKQAQDVYHFLKEAKEMESETASVSKQLLELLSIIIGDGEHHKTCSTGRERGTKDVSLSLLQQSDRQKERFKRALYVLEQMKETHKHMERLGNENESLKTLLSDLHKYVTSHTEINDSPFELSSTIEPDPPVANLFRQAQDVYQFLKETKERARHVDRMGNENEILKTLLSDLHKYVTPHMEINDSPFELSSTLRPDPPVANLYKQAQEVYHFLKEAKKIESLSEKDNDLNTLNKAWQGTYIKLQEEKERELDHKEKEWVQYCKSLTQQHEKEKEQLHNTLERLNSEKDNLLTRLSVIAADRLTHGNVNIADLSDPNRPTKLQEVYSELYDNEWTDAFQELTGHPNVSDKDAIRILLDILMCSFQMCREITWDRYERLKSVASSVEIIKRNPLLSDVKVMSDASEHGLAKEESGSTSQLGKTDATVDQRFGCTLDLDINLEKQIKDIWRTTTVALKEHAIKQLPSIIEAFLDMPCSVLPMTSKYLSICIDLCWNMGIHEKPLHLDNVSEKRFDKEKFKAYTHSGENVEFVVWPALFLYEGGPILAKGIAQGCSSDGKETNAVYV